jgi:hypothetical protein
LARQLGQWEEVVALAETALELAHQPVDPVERFVFIEGFAHAGEWDRAVALSQQSFEESQATLGAPLCKLWERVEAETGGTEARSEAINEVRTISGCNP